MVKLTLMRKAFPYTDIDIVTPRVCLEGNIALMQKRFPEIFNFSTEMFVSSWNSRRKHLT
jgi:hypothetical protein